MCCVRWDIDKAVMTNWESWVTELTVCEASVQTDTDTDTVWLKDPFRFFPAGYDMYIASDKEGVVQTMDGFASLFSYESFSRGIL